MDQSQEEKLVIRRSVDIYVSLALITLLGYLAIDLILPFVSILLWSVILSVGTYPAYAVLAKWLGGRSSLAAAVIAVLLLSILLLPMILIAQSIVDSVATIAERVANDDLSVPPPNASVAEWPLIGEELHALWSRAYLNLESVLQQFAPQLKSAAGSAISIGTSLLFGLLQFAMAIVFAAALLIYTEPLSEASGIVARRVAKTRGAEFLRMASATIRTVSRGLIGIAIAQGGAASIGFFVAGFPLAGVLSVLVIGAALVQFPALVIIPSIIYAWSEMTTGGALIFTAYMLPVLLLDNILKPVLMARGLTTPMIVIFIGVLGGTLSAGLLGLFTGPVILAVVYEMIQIWVRSIDPGDTVAQPGVASEPGD
ncbi:MAG: AI-2E family transporter [Pseudomonadota bacterium]